MEPFQSADTINTYRGRLGYQNSYMNRSGKIWIFWADEWQGLIVADTDQQVTLKMNLMGNGQEFFITTVYAKCDEKEREELWDSLTLMIPDNSNPWLVGGDFNVILLEQEKQGRLPVTVQETMDFVQCIQSCGLIDMGFTGSRFTWWNGRTQEGCIFKRLDRILCNQDFLNVKPNSQVHHLIRKGSDHAPLHLNWHADFEGNPFFTYHHKLKKLKKALSQWSKDTCGDIFQQISTLEDTIKIKELQFELAPTLTNREELHKEQAELCRFLYLEEEYWKQKAGMKWFKDGDRSTKFFHSYVIGKRKKLAVQRIQNQNGDWLTSIEDMGNEANHRLEQLPDKEEVRKAVFGLNVESASGPDGFTGQFYQKCWDIVGDAFTLMARSFFCGYEIP
ncbi:uncharacterized protein LOC132613188 [Lycium barbarum]|uniref:uncharacterized protein LOC132613188 n=1 Tax=Lycium barbarum TaxID=112863 RepID=UPI00293E86A7|nr:uncharacterized protein LOC132613188 [Lycium barbarum]